MSTASTLSPARARALFDILTHHETYAEIENFKSPGAIHHYGHPFEKAKDAPVTSPLLQTLLKKFILILPGLRDVSTEFWQKNTSQLVEKFAEAELSESYERGTLGARKTLATAISAVIEYPARGVFGGYTKKPLRDNDHQYDLSSADDILAGWEDFTQRLVYADMIDELFARASLTDKIEDHSSVVQAAHEFILVNLASFLHHVLILSPEGQYITRILENAHRLVPYSMVRQTLKVGNAATMIGGMVRLVLTKLSMTAVTNWMGWTSSTDDGMNLLQQIISQVLQWDTRELQKRSAKIEKEKDAPTKDQLKALKEYISLSREQHEKARNTSKSEGKSIASVIFQDAGLEVPTSDSQHTNALRYLTVQLDIRDREELIRILCRHSPDLLTQLVREAVSAFEPVIRTMHNAVDLSAGVWDAECFINDLIKLSKPKKTKSGKGSGGEDAPLPTVEDYVALLKKHQNSCHRYLHQISKNGPELSEWYLDWARKVLKEFREPESVSNKTSKDDNAEADAGNMTDIINSFVSDLSESDQKVLEEIADQHVIYLDDLRAASKKHFKNILTQSGHTQFGPGMYLAKWQSLLDDTLITPAQPSGSVRSGKSKDVRNASQLAGLGVEDRAEKKEVEDADKESKKMGVKVREKTPEAPNADIVIRLLGAKFREHLAKGIE